MISVIVITKNEEKMIKPCLESIKWVDEIIVYDNGSIDKTIEIAKDYTDKVFHYKCQDFAELRNKAMEKAGGDWVLFVDADERVLQPLKVELLEASKNSNNSAFAISRKNIIFGQAVDYGPYEKDWMIRFFRKDKFKTWVGKIHEYGTFEGELGYTQNSLLHLTHRSLDQFLLKSLEWSYVDAKLRLEAKHPPMTGWRFIRIFVTELWQQAVVRKGFFNGTVGIIDSILQTFSFFMSYVRLWEMQQSKPLEKFYEEIDKELIKNDFRE